MSKKFTSSWLLRNAQTILCPSDPTRDNRILLVGWRLWLSELAPGSPLMYERGPQSNTIPITHSLLFEIFYWNFGYLTGGNRSAIIHQPKIMIKVERLPVFYIHNVRLKSMSIKLLYQWWQAAAGGGDVRRGLVAQYQSQTVVFAWDDIGQPRGRGAWLATWPSALLPTNPEVHGVFL